MKIRPLQNRVVAKRTESETITAAGIIIPDNQTEKPVEGVIISVPVDIKEGDKILFGRYAGTEVKLDGQDYLIMVDDDILGIIE